VEDSNTDNSSMAPYLAVMGNGNVGIDDATPDALLEIKSNVGGTGYALFVSSQDDSTVILAVEGSGQVGIGEASPGTALHIVSSNTAGQLALKRSGDNQSNGMRFLDQIGDEQAHIRLDGVGSNDLWLVAATNQDIRFFTNSNMAKNPSGERMVILQNGNVGISTTTPIAELSVVGDGYFTGEVKASTFNTHGSAYLMNDTTVIDSDRNIYAGTLIRMTATADCSAATPGAAGELCMEPTNESQTLWISTSTNSFFPIENHGTSGCEGRFAMALSKDNSDWTTISVTTTFVTMNGTFVSTPTYNHDFTFSGATATYTGSDAHWFNVILTASLQMTSKDNDTAFAIYKNDALTSFGYKSVRIAKENTGWPGTAQDIVSLSNGDTVSVRVMNKTNTDNILCKEVTLTIEQMD